MIERDIRARIKAMAKKLPVLGLLGPRQSGKSTLVQHIFPDYTYVSLEDIEYRQFALSDPKAFLAQFAPPVIIDEAQYAPDLFSYIQLIVDASDQTGQFILTGSQHFLLLEKITQSLAGRIALLNLLPLSLSEIASAQPLNSIDTILYQGAYPRLYDRQLEPADIYPDYIQTYIERDVRSMQNIQDLGAFQRFIKLCAARVGQLVNFSSLAGDCGITYNTAKAWLSVLESSFIVYLLKPYYQNIGKQLAKSPKLYFYDTGIASYLLGIESASQLNTHYSRGSLFENLVINEHLKYYYNQGKRPSLYFFRDKSGNEVDLIIERAGKLIPIEIKSAQTFQKHFLKGIKQWKSLFPDAGETSYVIYGGDESLLYHDTQVVSWTSLRDIMHSDG